MSTCYYHSVAEQSIVSPPFLSISVEIAKAWAWAFRRATRAGSAPQVNIPMVELHELNEGFFTGKSAINDDNGGGSNLLLAILVRRTSIYQLFWGSMFE